jgi:SH3-like domain-containing protein
MITLTTAGQAFACIAALLLFAVTVPCQAAQPTPAAKKVTPPSYINAAKVNLRSGPDGEVLKQLDKGVKVFVVERQEGWVKVKIPAMSLTGWIANQFVDSKPAPLTQPQPKSIPAKQNANSKPLLAADEADIAPSGDLSTEIVLGDLVTSHDSVASVSSELPAARGASDAWQSAAPAAASLTFPEAPPAQGAPVINEPPTVADEIQRLDVLSAMPAPKTAATGTATDFVPDGRATVKSLAPAAKPVVIPASKPAAATKTAAPVTAKAAPKKLFSGDATTVVTTPLMLEGSFYAVGGRDMGKIDATDVNLRQKPNTGARSIAKLQPGDKLYLTSAKKDWYEVSVPARKLTGWVHSEFVHEFPKVEIKGTQVRLRDEPNTNSEIKDTQVAQHP